MHATPSKQMTTETIYLFQHWLHLNMEVGVQSQRKHLSGHSVSITNTRNCSMNFIQRTSPGNFSTFKKFPDCLSWYISDAAFVIGNSLAYIPLQFKDKGKHNTFMEMIHTWITYEVVKVLFLYGLNPKPSDNIDHVAPEIGDYIRHVTDPCNESYAFARKVQDILFKKTQHSSVFVRCNFSDVAAVTWKDDVKFMIPLVMLTWLRQLQQFFKKKNNRHSWSVLGNYTPIEKYTGGEGRDPLSLVYLSKPDAGISVKVTKYTNITPDESYNVNWKGIAIKSLEEWAMFILQPPVEKKLTNAAKGDSKT